MKISPDSHKFTLAEFVRQQRRMNPTTEFMLEFDGEELWVEAREEHHLQWKTYMGFIPRDVPPPICATKWCIHLESVSHRGLCPACHIIHVIT